MAARLLGEMCELGFNKLVYLLHRNELIKDLSMVQLRTFDNPNKAEVSHKYRCAVTLEISIVLCMQKITFLQTNSILHTAFDSLSLTLHTLH